MQERELSVVLWSWGLLLSVIGTLIAIGGSMLGYIFTRHRADNDCDHTEIKDLIEKVSGKIEAVRIEVKDDIVRIHDRIDNLQE